MPRLWRRCEWFIFTSPLLVTLNLLAVALCVLIFPMIGTPFGFRPFIQIFYFNGISDNIKLYLLFISSEFFEGTPSGADVFL